MEENTPFYNFGNLDLPTIEPTVLFEAFGVNITSSLLSGILITIVFSTFAVIFAKHIKNKIRTNKIQAVLEMVYESLYGLVKQITGNHETTHKILPIILAIIVYLTFANTLSIIPFLGAIEFDGTPIFTTNTSDLNATLGIAMTVIIWTQYLSIKKNNLFGHINKYIRVGSIINGFKHGIGKGFLSIIDFFVGLLDIISEFAKSLSLSLRLFGNMFAGELLTTLLLQAFAIILPVALLIFSAFTGFLQAFVFAALAASYFGVALKDD